VRLVGAGHSPDDILWELMLEDIRAAADSSGPYDSTAAPTASEHRGPLTRERHRRSIGMARDLFRRVCPSQRDGQDPGHPEGLPPSEDDRRGREINVTLIFATELYDESWRRSWAS